MRTRALVAGELGAQDSAVRPHPPRCTVCRPSQLPDRLELLGSGQLRGDRVVSFQVGTARVPRADHEVGDVRPGSGPHGIRQDQLGAQEPSLWSSTVAPALCPRGSGKPPQPSRGVLSRGGWARFSGPSAVASAVVATNAHGRRRFGLAHPQETRPIPVNSECGSACTGYR